MTTATTSGRIASVDQFRGYTVAGMFLVNFLGGFAAVPYILKHHHDYCSYADTIMPQFLFAVGFAFRLTFERRIEREGARVAYDRVVRRLLGLAIIAMVIYTPPEIAKSWSELQELGLSALARPLKREWFQTLMHIAVTSLWVLVVIRCRASFRVLFGVVSALLHVLLSYAFNFTWVNSDPVGIDGGPFGFLTWSIPMIVGTLACDLMTSSQSFRITRLVMGALILMTLGWVLSCGTRMYDVPPQQVETLATEKLADDPVLPEWDRVEAWAGNVRVAEPPFVPPPDAAHRKWNYWMMSQRSGTLSYLTFASGFSLLVYAGFHLCCDRFRWRLGLFETLGRNALAAYILHELVNNAVSPFVPDDAPGWYIMIGFGIFFGVTWLMVATLERNRIYLRV